MYIIQKWPVTNSPTEEAMQISIFFILWYLPFPLLLNPQVLQGGGDVSGRADCRRNMLMLHKGDAALFWLFQRFWWKGQGVEVEFYRREEDGLWLIGMTAKGHKIVEIIIGYRRWQMPAEVPFTTGCLRPWPGLMRSHCSFYKVNSYHSKN